MAVPKLNEQMAIELGANLLGEIIIFVIGAGVLILEYQRQARKEAMKEEMAIQERLELQATLNELAFQAERQDTQIRELTRILADIGARKKQIKVDKKISSSFFLLLLDSKSWTPKILTDIVGRKKIQSECKENEENPLELLPEKRSRTKQTSTQKVLAEKNSNESGNEQSLIQAINFLITEVFYSQRQQSPPEEIIKGDSVLAKSLNYLFVDAGDIKC